MHSTQLDLFRGEEEHQGKSLGEKREGVLGKWTLGIEPKVLPLPLRYSPRPQDTFKLPFEPLGLLLNGPHLVLQCLVHAWNLVFIYLRFDQVTYLDDFNIPLITEASLGGFLF